MTLSRERRDVGSMMGMETRVEWIRHPPLPFLAVVLSVLEGREQCPS